MPQSKRLSPEKFLERLQEEEHLEKRGKLKIYLGAAPGVGKTYSMLQDANAQRTQDLDVVVGIVETHGRKEVESLLNTLEVLPRQQVEYRGNKLNEFDLDAALKRSPALILIDEMAHTNAPGLRHAKRWQDIKELLDRGINVYTTLNVQHIESLNDDVAQIIHAPIKETIPDTMLELATTIELVDLPPEDLLKRLREGKIYIPQQATLAAEMFFRKGNLIALRELALRFTADRVGTQVFLYRQGQGIQHIWPTREKILVCVGSRPESLKLIRAAKRMASSLQIEWIAAYVHVPQVKYSDEKRNKAIQNLRLAEQLGATTHVLTGFDIVKEIMTYARAQNVTQIMVWKHIRKRWQDFFFRSLADEIVRNSQEIDIYIMTGQAQHLKKQPQIADKQEAFSWKIYFFATLIVTAITVFNFFLSPIVSQNNFGMIYLLGVITIALFGRVGPSLLGAILSALLYDFFFVPPYLNFSIADMQYFITVLVMVVVGQVITHLTILTRRQMEAVRLTENQTSLLYILSKRLASTRGIDKLLQTGVTYIATVFNSDVIALLPQKDALVIKAGTYTKKSKLNAKELGVAQWVYELGQVAGLGTDTLSFSNALYVPLLGSQSVIGVLRVQPLKSKNLISPEQMNLLQAAANQIALALEVDRLQENKMRRKLPKDIDDRI